MEMKLLLQASAAIAFYTTYFIAILYATRVPRLEESALGRAASYKEAPKQKPKEWVRVKHSGPRILMADIKSQVELECEINGSPTPGVKWLHDGKIVSQTIMNVNKANDAQYGAVKSILSIDCVTPQHEGKYICVAESGLNIDFSDPTELLVEGSYSNTSSEEICTQVILNPPRIITWSPLNLETVGNDVILPCVVSGKPTPQIYWLDNYENIITEDSEKNTRYMQLESGFLLISKIVWTDMGYFTCVAESPLGKNSEKLFVYPMHKD